MAIISTTFIYFIVGSFVINVFRSSPKQKPAKTIAKESESPLTVRCLLMGVAEDLPQGHKWVTDKIKVRSYLNTLTCTIN